MKICVRVSCKNTEKNRECLESKQITYGAVLEDFLVFDIFSDDERYLDVMRDVQGTPVFECAVYSDEELFRSKWLLMRSKCGKVASANDDYTFEYTCPLKNTDRFHHQKQVREYVVSKQIAWKNKNHFYADAEGDLQTVFCSEYAKEQFTAHHVIGIDFEHVLSKSTMLPVPDLFQLRFTNKLSHEALILPKDLEIRKCSQCGREQIYIPNPNHFVLGVRSAYLDQNTDAYITEDLFGEGFGYHLLIVSHSVYELIKEMRERNMTFTPIRVE